MRRYTSMLRTFGFAAAICLALVGCGREKLAPATGVVSHNGERVKGGTFIFSPVGTGNPGRPAAAIVQQDGSFTVFTYGKNDGALVGRHRVTYTPPEPDLTTEQRSDPNYFAQPSPYAGCAPKDVEVEIKPGANQLQIELITRS